MNLNFWKKRAIPVEAPAPTAPRGNAFAPLAAWDWSATPGGHERHLQRRWRNPLFREERRLFSEECFRHARLMDEEAIIPLLIEVQGLQRNWPADLPVDSLRWCHETRGIVDDLLNKYNQIGGNSSVLDLLMSMRHCVIETWTTLLADSPDQLASLNAAERARDAYSFLDNTFANQVLGGKYIPDDEILPSILCEPVENIRAYCASITFDLSDESATENISILRNLLHDTILIATTDLFDYNLDSRYFDDKISACQVQRISA